MYVKQLGHVLVANGITEEEQVSLSDYSKYIQTVVKPISSHQASREIKSKPNSYAQKITNNHSFQHFPKSLPIPLFLFYSHIIHLH